MIKQFDTLPQDLTAEAWTLYEETFRDLNAYAVQRHLMTYGEFTDVMDDARVEKYLVLDGDGAIVGMSTYTNDLAAMPLISPAYFERRWPDLYTTRRIWYCGFVAVHPRGQGTTAFGELVEAMYRVAAAQNGIIALDICRHNQDSRHLDRVIPLMLHRLSGDVRTERMDEQSFWLYEFPEAVA